MKQYLLMLLVASGLLALIPTQSKAQVVISVRPAYSNGDYSNGYYSNGYYYQGQPYYHHGYSHRYYRYNHDQRYYRGHRYYND